MNELTGGISPDILTHFSLLIYSLSFAMCFAALALCIACWIKEKETWQYKTILFIIYFTFLFFLDAIYFYYTHIMSYSEGGWYFGLFLIIRDLGYALLLYYMGATLNYIRRKKWSHFQLSLVILGGIFYFAGSVVDRYTGSPLYLSAAMSLLLFGVQAYLLANSARDIKHVSEVRLRISLIIVFLVPLIFLPLILIFRSLMPERQALNFIVLSQFYFWLSLGAVIYFLQPLALHRSGGGLNLSRENRDKFGLTEREAQIIRGIDRGLSYKEIAGELDISPNTVSNHITRIYRKTGIRSKVELLKKLQ
ncbi:MAG: helix-turn-helix transcriptional regulator [Spirochaetales bacterium]|nr:helix-turn-helix transcriptional regulator [Spirochaetales bacterium]